MYKYAVRIIIFHTTQSCYMYLIHLFLITEIIKLYFYLEHYDKKIKFAMFVTIAESPVRDSGGANICT